MRCDTAKRGRRVGDSLFHFLPVQWSDIAVPPPHTHTKTCTDHSSAYSSAAPLSNVGTYECIAYIMLGPNGQTE